LRSSSIIIAAVIVIASVCARADEPTYPIHFERASHKGDREAFEIVYAEHTSWMTWWSGLDVAQKCDEVWGAHLIVDGEILEVEQNSVVRELLTVRLCTMEKDDRETVLIPPGGKILAKAEGNHAVFTVDGKPPNEQTLKVLSAIVALCDAASDSSDNVLFGTSTSRKIGESWPINANAFIDSWKPFSMSMEPKDVFGSVKLASIEDCNGVQCEKIAVDTNIENYQIPQTSDSEKIKKASRSAHQEFFMPLSADKSMPQYASTSTVRFISEGRSQGRSYTQEEIVSDEFHIRDVPKNPNP
jgi:hypothetical protein